MYQIKVMVKSKNSSGLKKFVRLRFESVKAEVLFFNNSAKS